MKGRLDRTRRVYEQNAETYLAQWARRSYRVPPLLRSLLAAIPEKAWVLDAGCGPGQDTRYLTHHGYRAVGMDSGERLLQWGKRKTPRARWIRADLRKPPVRRGGMDAVWAAASMIHLTKREFRTTLKALGEAAGPQAVLAATLVHGKASGVLRRGWLPGRYVSRWTKAELARAVLRAGWRIESIEVVSNRERKGRWINLMARRASD